jgi:hypothetical protein
MGDISRYARTNSFQITTNEIFGVYARISNGVLKPFVSSHLRGKPSAPYFMYLGVFARIRYQHAISPLGSTFSPPCQTS